MGRACSTKEESNAYRFSMRNPEGRRLLGRPTRDGRIILKWILEKSYGVVWTGFI
jgi:hypothetical protein